ncbi:acid-sensing ion channel 4-A-like isoform X2 [Ornithodoros turicata]|uniref:acid-sensing ion channel 4-A-like isoform X2 n=1 Tax=Ornithodoros turicata TaxID=34597 RepID=UPI003139A78C
MCYCRFLSVGFKVILGFSPPLRRILWVSVLASLSFFGLQDMYDVFRDFAEYSDTVDVVLARPPDGLAMPAVSFCNLNQVRRSVFCGDIVLNRSTASEWQQKLCTDDGPLPIWLPEDEASDRKQFFKWVAEMQRRNEAMAELLGHQREDMVVDCTINGASCNSASKLQLQMYGRYGNCYCFGCNMTYPPHKLQIINKASEGLQLLLNVEPEEYLSLSVEAGFVVAVHQAGVEVDFRKDGVFLPPYYTTFISVTQSVQERLEPPYRNPCQPTWPEEYLQYVPEGHIYTSSACKEMCAQMHVLKTCKCQSHDYVILDRSLANICLEEDEATDACIAGVASKIMSMEIHCPCLPSCSSITYTQKVSSLQWTKYSDPRKEPTMSKRSISW